VIHIAGVPWSPAPFSILERIDVGETSPNWRHSPGRADLSVSSNGSTWVKQRSKRWRSPRRWTFSILERIDVGETRAVQLEDLEPAQSFSILERIDVGETLQFALALVIFPRILSVSSNGSTWVKHF